MIRCLIGLLSAVAATLIALNFNVGSAASAQRPKPQACEASKDLDQNIAICTARIESGLDKQDDLVNDYNVRGGAYALKGRADLAIVDYTQAINIGPQRANSYLRRAEAFLYTKNYARAVADLDRVIELNPKNDAALATRCWARALLGKNLEGALSDCNDASRLRPNNRFVPINRGLVELKLGKFSEAASDYDSALQINPKSAEALYGRGIAKLRAGDVTAGNTDIVAAQAMQANVAEVYAEYGIAAQAQAQSASGESDDYKECQQTNDIDRSIAACSRAINNQKASPPATYAVAYNNRGKAYNHKGDYDRAIADFDEAIRLDPKYVFAYNNRGNAYRYRDDYDGAIVDYDEAIRLDPKYETGYNNRGNAYYHKGDYDRAIADFDEAIRLDPKSAVNYMNRGNPYQAKGDYDRAIANYDEAIRLDSKFAYAYINRGNAYQHKGDYDRAIADYTEAIRLEPRIAEVYGSRAVVYLHKGERDRAIGDYRVANGLDPEKISAMVASDPELKEIADAAASTPERRDGVATAAPPAAAATATEKDYSDCQQTSDVDRSIAACTRIAADPTQSATDRALAWRWLGNDHVATGALGEAVGDYSEAIKLDPRNVASYASRALVYLAKGDRVAAIADYRQAVIIDPARIGGMVAGNAELRNLAQAAAELLDAVVEIPATGSARRTGPALGFVIDPSGLVVTLQDAVGDAKNVTLVLKDGTKLDAEVVGIDIKTDLAVLKAKTDKQLKALQFGDSSKVTVAQTLAGFANTSVAEDSLKLGPVTALDRSLGVGPYDNFVVIDLAVGQPTSDQAMRGSGGPIFSPTGEVIGTTSDQAVRGSGGPIFSLTGDVIGIHVATLATKFFATPAADAVPIIDQLRRYGEVRRGWLGVQIAVVSDDIADRLHIKPARGALVARVDDRGPAKAGGIELDDVIVKFDGRDVEKKGWTSSPLYLPRIVADTPVGKEVEVVVIRKGKEETHIVKIGRLEDSR